MPGSAPRGLARRAADAGQDRGPGPKAFLVDRPAALSAPPVAARLDALEGKRDLTEMRLALRDQGLRPRTFVSDRRALRVVLVVRRNVGDRREDLIKVAAKPFQLGASGRPVLQQRGFEGREVGGRRPRAVRR